MNFDNKKYDYRTSDGKGTLTYGYKLANGVTKEVSYKNGQVVSKKFIPAKPLTERQQLHNSVEKFNNFSKPVSYKSASNIDVSKVLSLGSDDSFINKYGIKSSKAVEKYVNYLCNRMDLSPGLNNGEIKNIVLDVRHQYEKSSDFRKMVDNWETIK